MTTKYRQRTLSNDSKIAAENLQTMSLNLGRGSRDRISNYSRVERGN